MNLVLILSFNCSPVADEEVMENPLPTAEAAALTTSVGQPGTSCKEFVDQVLVAGLQEPAAGLQVPVAGLPKAEPQTTDDGLPEAGPPGVDN